jgi:hypothetical protein
MKFTAVRCRLPQTVSFADVTDDLSTFLQIAQLLWNPQLRNPKFIRLKSLPVVRPCTLVRK